MHDGIPRALRSYDLTRVEACADRTTAVAPADPAGPPGLPAGGELAPASGRPERPADLGETP